MAAGRLTSSNAHRLGYDSCSTMSMGSSVTMLADMAPYLSTCRGCQERAKQAALSEQRWMRHGVGGHGAVLEHLQVDDRAEENGTR